MTPESTLLKSASLALCLLAAFLPVIAISGDGDAGSKPIISFRLDTGITRGMYMGERWVSPPDFSAVGKGQKLAVTARSAIVGADGRLREISAEWSAGDVNRITLSARHGEEVAILVQCDADNTVAAAYHGQSTMLFVKSTCKDGVITVEIAK